MPSHRSVSLALHVPKVTVAGSLPKLVSMFPFAS